MDSACELPHNLKSYSFLLQRHCTSIDICTFTRCVKPFISEPSNAYLMKDLTHLHRRKFGQFLPYLLILSQVSHQLKLNCYTTKYSLTSMNNYVNYFAYNHRIFSPMVLRSVINLILIKLYRSV